MYSSIEMLEKWFSAIRSILISIIAFATIAALIVNLHGEFRKTIIIVEPFSSPPSLKSKGFDPTMLAKKVIDEINLIRNTISQETGNSEVLLNQSSDIIDEIELAPSRFSTKSIIHWFRKTMHSPVYKISGEFLEIDSTFVLNARVNSNNSVAAKGGFSKIDSLIHEVIIKLYLDINPYEVFSYHLVRNDKDRNELKSVLNRGLLSNDVKKFSWSTFGLGKLDFIEGEYKGALEQFYRVVEFDESISVAYHGIALCYYQLNDYAMAENFFKKAINESYSDEKILYSWGTMLMNLNQKQKALEKFQEAINSNPLYANSYYNLGILLFELKKFNKAKRALEIYKSLEHDINKSQKANNIIKEINSK